MADRLDQKNRPDLALLQRIDELALGGLKAKKELIMAKLISSISFISPVAMLTMAAIGTITLGPIPLTVMGLFALLNSKSAWTKNKNTLYKAFFDPYDKLVIEFDTALKQIISPSVRLQILYRKEMRKMFTELKDVPEQATVKEARIVFRHIYIKHMSVFIKALNKVQLPMSTLVKKRFFNLQKQLKRARLLK